VQQTVQEAAQQGTAAGDVDLAAVGAVLADRARARILLALGDGRSLPASVLAAEAGVAASTASEHLARLTAAGLVTVTPRGRFRYYRLAGPEVGELIETLARLAPAAPVRSLREGTRAHAVRRARSCYDHLAGRLGVAVTGALLDAGQLVGGDGDGYRLTGDGRVVLTGLGARLPEGAAVRCCVDWTEQRPHLAGAHGRALLTALLDRGWLRRPPRGRALLLTDDGAEGLARSLGVRLGS
jgi:DNA-binding transcriptional ArsR family regulator